MPTLVQNNSNSYNAISGTVALSSAVTSGNLLTLIIAEDGDGGAGNDIVSVTDSLSNTWKSGVSKSISFGAVNPLLWGYYTQTTSGGSVTVTVVLKSGVTTHLLCDEFNGVSTTLDSTSTGNGSGTAMSVASFTPTNNSAILAGIWHGGNPVITAGSGYVLINQPLNADDEWSSGVTGSQTAPFTQSAENNWEEVAMAFTTIAPAKFFESGPKRQYRREGRMR